MPSVRVVAGALTRSSVLGVIAFTAGALGVTAIPGSVTSGAGAVPTRSAGALWGRPR